tara:strand:- start:574 stop:789 length:216 start_codon:yes stop_codon:yes gene_type:complete
METKMPAKIYVKPVFFTFATFFKKGYFRLIRCENFFEIQPHILLRNEDLHELGLRGIDIVVVIDKMQPGDR